MSSKSSSSSSLEVIELQPKWKTMTPIKSTILIYLLAASLSANLTSASLSSQNKQMNIPIPLNSVKQLTGNNRPGQPNNNNLASSATTKNSSLASQRDPLDTPGDWFMMDQDELAPQEGKLVASYQDPATGKHSPASTRRSGSSKTKKSKQHANSSNRTFFDDDSSLTDSDTAATNEVSEDAGEEGAAQAGSVKEPECAGHGRYYCTFKEDYPLKLVTEVTKYYKWPLEKLFRDLHAQIMPKLAQDSTGNLVCDSITRVVRPGWARNTNERWLVVINTDNYHQYVTEVVCQYGSNSRCNFIPPCYYSSCQQRYNTQKLLVIDPSNPYRGPFLSEFLFPSCCVCYVPSAGDSFQDKYRSSPATIYQRTMQQESANNIYPPQFKPAGLLEEPQQGSLSAGSEHPSSPARLPSNLLTVGQVSGAGSNAKEAAGQQAGATGGQAGGANQAAGPGEIRRRAGEAFRQQQQELMELNNFPRLGLSDSLESNSQTSSSGAATAGNQQ